MGILNVTPDSFAEASPTLDPAAAIDRALRMQEEGADIIDVGGESTRPGSEPIGAIEELARVLPVVRGLAKRITRAPLGRHVPGGCRPGSHRRRRIYHQ